MEQEVISTEKQSYFQAALANFTFDVASGGAIRHLADLGYTVTQITKRLDFPTPYERVQQTVWEHFLQTGILRLEEPGTAAHQENNEYITEYDSYGRKSFRRVTLSTADEESVLWNVQTFPGKTGKELAAYLAERCKENGEETAYVCCHFGLLCRREPEKAKAMLTHLEENDREYVQDLPWERRIVYHRLNRRMRNILVSLYPNGGFTTTCYFTTIKEKLLL